MFCIRIKRETAAIHLGREKAKDYVLSRFACNSVVSSSRWSWTDCFHIPFILIGGWRLSLRDTFIKFCPIFTEEIIRPAGKKICCGCVREFLCGKERGVSVIAARRSKKRMSAGNRIHLR